MSKRLIIVGLLFIATTGYPQTQRKIKGEILDEDKKPLPGLAVVQLGTTTGTVTDIDGRFELIIDSEQITYIKLSGLDLEILLDYSEKEEFKKVTLKNWQKIKKENKRISKEWKRKQELEQQGK